MGRPVEDAGLVLNFLPGNLLLDPVQTRRRFARVRQLPIVGSGGIHPGCRYPVSPRDSDARRGYGTHGRPVLVVTVRLGRRVVTGVGAAVWGRLGVGAARVESALGVGATGATPPACAGRNRATWPRPGMSTLLSFLTLSGTFCRPTFPSEVPGAGTSQISNTIRWARSNCRPRGLPLTVAFLVADRQPVEVQPVGIGFKKFRFDLGIGVQQRQMVLDDDREVRDALILGQGLVRRDIRE